MPHIESLIPARTIRKILDISPSAEINLRKLHTLPQPLRIGRANFYVREELKESIGLKSTFDDSEVDHA